MRPRRVVVLFGGRSPEHWISVKSGLFVLLHLDPRLWETSCVYVRQDGTFAGQAEGRRAIAQFLADNRVVLFRPGTEPGLWTRKVDEAFSHDGDRFMAAAAEGAWEVIFPVFHGRFGEDGTVQGLAETLGIPYVGCDYRASALGMDKILTKKICAAQGLEVSPYREIRRDDWTQDRPLWMKSLPGDLGWPLFVKPARLGSSIGVNRATDEASLARALEEAFAYDYRVLVESEIHGSEYAVGVLGRGAVSSASVVAEYTSRPENFGYDSKYGPQSLEDIVPARLSSTDTETMRTFARDVFAALRVRGFCRVDSFWGPRGPVLNEVNTMPGLNPGSPFIRAWETAGWDATALLTQAVRLARGEVGDQNPGIP